MTRTVVISHFEFKMKISFLILIFIFTFVLCNFNCRAEKGNFPHCLFWMNNFVLFFILFRVVWKDERCSIGDYKGYCNIRELKYFFDSDGKECILKYKGDCSGDKNLFNSRSECEKACLNKDWNSKQLRMILHSSKFTYFVMILYSTLLQ